MKMLFTCRNIGMWYFLITRKQSIVRLPFLWFKNSFFFCFFFLKYTQTFLHFVFLFSECSILVTLTESNFLSQSSGDTQPMKGYSESYAVEKDKKFHSWLLPILDIFWYIVQSDLKRFKHHIHFQKRNISLMNTSLKDLFWYVWHYPCDVKHYRVFKGYD